MEKCRSQVRLESLARSPKISSAFGMLSRGKSWFVDELQIANAELRSSTRRLWPLSRCLFVGRGAQSERFRVGEHHGKDMQGSARASAF